MKPSVARMDGRICRDGEIFAIFNPTAGGGSDRSRALQAVDRLRGNGHIVEVAETSHPGDATHLASAAFKNGERNFISIGGDGTGFEIVNGLMMAPNENGARLTLGFIPMGTGNSFLRDFPDPPVESLLAGKRRPCDVMCLTHKNGVLHFINILSLGFAADVAALRNRLFASFGELGYILAVLGKVAFLRPQIIPLRIDGDVEDSSPVTFISINNTRFTAEK